MVLWTAIMSVLAFIPIIGMSFIFIPTTIYLFIVGKWGWALVVFIGCNIISLVVENVYKPKFIGKKLQIDSLLLLFGIIGGLSYFRYFTTSPIQPIIGAVCSTKVGHNRSP